MILNHLNLAVTDVPAARRFLETYFGLQAHTDPYTGTATGAGDHPSFVVLFDERGMVLTLMKARTADYPGTFHIGFIQPTEAAVDALHARLTADGFAADAPARSHAYTFYVKAPGGFVVEVLC
jgi:catechol 2,3-dioxygenase-like lactoylglutathione lyase family enzyme